MSRKLPGSAIVSNSITLNQISGGLNDTTNASYAQANTARTTANDAYGQANTARDQANTARTQANTAYDQANNARGQANTAYGQANNAYSSANLAYTQANSARSDINTTFATVNTTFGTINTNYQAAYAQANTGYSQANAAYGQANAAYGAANTRLSASGGTLSGDLIITGNLTVSGNQTILNTEVLTTEDAEIILLSNTAGTPALNAGLIINRGTSTNTFLRWNETLDEWGWSDSGTTTYYFEDLRAGLATTNTTFGTVNTSLGTINTSYQAAYAQANTAGTNALNAYGQANTARDQANTARTQANTAYDQANSAYGAANNRVLKAGDTMTGQLNISSGGLLVTGTAQATYFYGLAAGTNDSANFGNSQSNLRIGGNGSHVTLNVAPWGFNLVAGSGSGNTALYVNTSGSVGVGTTTPNATVQIYSSNTTPALLRLETPGNSLNTVFWMEDYDTNVAAKAVATMDLSSGLGLFNLYAGAYTASGGNYYGSTRGASRLGMHDNVFNFYTANASGAGHSTGTAITWYQTLQSSNANFIVYTNNGTERLRVDANGNVGIGTTSPTAALHVSGTSGDSAPTFRINGTTAAATFNWAGSIMNSSLGSSRNTILLIGQAESNRNCGYIGFNHSGTSGSNTNFLTFGLHSVDNVLNITGAGNVGIGTTNPSQKLDVYGYATTSRLAVRSGAHVSSGFLGGRSDWVGGSQDDNFAIGSYQSAMCFFTNNSVTERMRIDSSGNVGIGTNSPNEKLNVVGNITLDWAQGRAYRIKYYSGGTYDAGIRLHSTARGLEVYSIMDDNNEGIIFTTGTGASNGEKLRINNSGNVGIANTAPAVRLQIGNLSSVSTSSPETVSLGGTFSSSAGGNPKLRIWTDGSNSIGLGVSSDQFDYIATGAYSHVFYQSGSERMRINSSGHLVPGANATYNLGSTSLRWSTVYTSDLDLSNGIGDWTIVEGEDDLFIYNNKRNKVYKFKLEEVDPATAVPKKENL